MSKEVQVALITSAATIIAALIAAGFFVKNADVNTTATTKELEVGVEYKAEETGFVFVTVHASQDSRHIRVEGFLDGKKVAVAEAQDSVVLGVPSIGESSFTLPISKGSQWRINQVDGNPNNVKVEYIEFNSSISLF